MKRFESVKVAGHIYQIQYMPEEWGDEMVRQGDCCPTSLRIRISPNARWKETLIHEIGHAIYYEYSIGHCSEEESTNSLYMSGMHQVMVDNPSLIRELL
jgi:hypothetical protein